MERGAIGRSLGIGTLAGVDPARLGSITVELKRLRTDAAKFHWFLLRSVRYSFDEIVRLIVETGLW
jgi:hypothetical protein